MTFKEATILFKRKVKITKAKATYDFYCNYINRLVKDLGDIECCAIDDSKILDYIENRKVENPNVSNATLNKHITTLKTVLKESAKIEIKFSKLKERQKIIPTVSKDSSKDIFRYLENKIENKYAYRNYLFFKIIYDTGLRLSEITHLKVQNYDQSKEIINVNITKTKVDRTVILSNKTSQMLTDFIKKFDIKEYIFTNFKSNSPLSTSAVECLTYRLKKKLELNESVTPHKWRHTFATNYIKFGGTLEPLRSMMGHASLKTTQKYLHLTQADIINEYRKVMANA